VSHRLDPLLRPRSIAVVGASEREHSVGRTTVHNLLAGGFEGTLYAVNPGRETVLGQPCFPSLAALPERVDHVVFCVHDRHVEAALDETIQHGAPAATIMSQLILEEDPGLADRIRARVAASDLLLCGPNGMGFYNGRDGVWLCGFDTRENHVRGGNVTLISQSGAGMSGIVDCEERLDFNLAVSSGSEFTVDLADYLDFAIECHAPAAIGLFMETARNPSALVAALEKAAAHAIPVVALKVGRTTRSARLAQSHSGAVAGEDAAFQAIFDHHGVQRVSDMHELVASLMLFAQPAALPATGGLVTLHDSGGERQLLVDLADELGVPLPELGSDSRKALAARLDPGLPAVNPLDGWGAGGPDADDIMADCLAILLQDEDAAIGAVVHDRAPHSGIYPDYLDYLRHARKQSDKPLALVSNHQGSGTDPLAVAATREGFPVIDGLRPFLVAVRSVLAWNDWRQRGTPHFPQLPEATLKAAKAAVSAETALDEEASLAVLRTLGLPATECRVVTGEAEAVDAASTWEGAVVLKTAMPDLAHKSDAQGVHLAVDSEAAVRAAYRDLAQRLGPRVLVAPMAPDGVELVLGMVHDQQFGPLVLLGFGGVGVEALQDTRLAVPPFDAAQAHRLLQCLRLRPLLDIARGRPAPDLDAFADLAARFSVAVHHLGDALAEADLNPVIVHGDGCCIVDALIIPAPKPAAATQSPRRRKAS
jgi:acyl-CoA synthetase (NDP forming)